ncbi:SigE family RNA polymerase sigma factor [Luteipulveratus mongoliensis]|uniref:RNA polymerase n=1 Tax=Luteipulveratus mongoliensis TaxID=571913 RepID=A0A0K1JJD8_9MICO|nr:SigE family RNA polymerase sigma factor [Luteipulveratus mongoliensis]AKU16839.1 hypothetical protein VV02_14795 [Luteipulveratus mongoliensis]
MTSESDEAFSAFVASSSPQLLRTGWLLCGDEHLAEELVQEALARVYPRWGRLADGQPLAYARRILVNLNTDRWRRGRRETVAADGDMPERPVDDGSSAAVDRDLLIRLLGALPRRERQVVVLRHYADLSEQQVADLLDVSVGTVKSSASRGLAVMRSHLTSIEEAV